MDKRKSTLLSYIHTMLINCVVRLLTDAKNIRTDSVT